MSEKKHFQENNETRKQESPKNKEINSWILNEKDKKDLESRIVSTLKSLNSKLTKKEILELFERVEVNRWLEWLKKELEKEKKLWWKEISDELLKTILDLINESKEITQKNIEELKLEIDKLNESKDYKINKEEYLTNKFPWIKKFEDSELWKNIIIDIAWMWLWIVDSTIIIFKFLLSLIKDTALLPVDLIKKISKK